MVDIKIYRYDEVIVYCGSGVTATVPYLLMDEIGMEPKMYPITCKLIISELSYNYGII